MSIGTKSILYGYHQFIFHPLLIALAWWRLYGFPWDPRLWVAFFVHDLGYWGKANMDGPQGELHPWLGARIMRWLFGPEWFYFTLYHSRFLARAHGVKTSRLCAADKYAIILCPVWLQIALTSVTGEISEYMQGQNGRTNGDNLTKSKWVKAMQLVIRNWMANQDIPVPAAFPLLHPVQSIRLWWTFKRVCCYCNRPHRLSGAPWAKIESHDLCKRALNRELIKLGQAPARLSTRRSILSRMNSKTP